MTEPTLAEQIRELLEDIYAAINIDPETRGDLHDEAHVASGKIDKLCDKVEALQDGAVCAEVQARCESLEELVAALDSLLGCYRIGDTRRGGQAADRVTQAREALEEK